MYIKKIIIEGFRSYRERNELSDLSPKHNIIIGRNGSGKSNVFNAIQFVLSDEFCHLNSQQRQQLVHESGAQTRLLTAFVEIIVDNSDRRLPIDSPQISFRRQIGLKKDQYFLNSKITSHSDIVNLLETAGFSRSNPYYIVKQGKVTEMAIASDEYRLNVMRGVAGTQIYDRRKSEAMKLLAEANQKSLQIDDCLKSLNERLIDLQNESKELNGFIKWDKRKRLLEYTILNKESENTKNRLIKVEDKQLAINGVLDDKRSKLQELQQKSKVIEKKLKSITNVIEEYRNDIKEINKSIEECAEERARIESKINDFKETLDENNSNESKVSKELEELNEEIEKKKKRLVFVDAKYRELKSTENSVFREYKAKESRRVELYQKQKRKEVFNTVEERDRWIAEELPKLEKEIESKRKRIAELKKEEYERTKKRNELEEEQKGFVAEETNLIKSLQNQKKEWFELNKTVKELESKRSEFWDSENDLIQKELKLSEEKLKFESNLSKRFGSSAIVGRQSVEKVLDSWRQTASNSAEEGNALNPLIKGYLGQVIDCFSCDTNINRAVEVTAKSKLFYHIVENDSIGTQIISEVNKHQMLGDITFIALNKLNVHEVNYPDLGNNARPLTRLINFDKKYEKVMRFLFDKTLICRTLEMASIFARSSRLDCVTLEGDSVTHKGVMSGGCFRNDSGMELFFKWRNSISIMNSIRQQLNELIGVKEQNENQLSSASNSLSNLFIKQTKTKRKLDNLRISKDNVRHHLAELNQSIESIGKNLSSLESILPSIIANRDSFQSELSLSLDSQLNESERIELNEIVTQLERLDSMHKELCKKRIKFGTDKSILESDLEKNLEQRRNELEFTLIDIKISENENNFENESLNCDLMDKRIASLRKQSEKLNSKIDELIKQQNDQKELLENVKLAEDKQTIIVDNEVKKSSQLSIKINNYEKKLEEMNKKLRNLGTIPSDSETNYTNMCLSKQYEELRKCNQKLSRFTKVNRKALDQLNDGQEKALMLTKEKQEIDSGYESIQKLIESLEHRKYEAIQITYRQVSIFFAKIFKKLVPEGKAFIDMIYSDTNGVSSVTSSQTSQETQSSGGISVLGAFNVNQIDNFIGVKIRVAFTGTSVVKEMNQLSGGQKSIVALAFIFAIQMCDPAPFYLFDEVDQALDPLYRKALADIIRESSKSAQFITTTFRPELLESADKFYGVKLRNRISHCEEIDERMAKEFIESEEEIQTSFRRAEDVSQRRTRAAKGVTELKSKRRVTFGDTTGSIDD